MCRSKAGNGTDDLRGGADARVRPDDGVLDARAFFDEAARAEHGVDDLRAGFDLAVVADHREIIDLRNCRGIKLPSTFLDVKTSNTSRQQIIMHL